MSGTSPRTMARHTDRSVSDKGFWADIPASLYELHDASAVPVPLGAATAPVLAFGGNVIQANWATTTTAAFTLSKHLPRDYALGVPMTTGGVNAKVTGALKVRLLLRAAIAAATIGGPSAARFLIYTRNQFAEYVNGVLTQRVSALKGPFKPVNAIVTLPTNPTDPSWYEFDFTGALDASGNRIEPGDVLMMQIGLEAHANSGNVELHDFTIAYRKNAAFTRISER